MFGSRKFEPWIGKNYDIKNQRVKLLVLGESRYDEAYTDNRIIQELIRGWKKRNYTKRTHTNFIQVMVEKHHWETGYDPAAFWQSVIYYNYNTTFFPGEARASLPWKKRMDRRNQRFLRCVLQKCKPTHVIVWGFQNWETIAVQGASWTTEQSIPRTGVRPDSDPYCAVIIDGHKSIFTRIKHPSSGFVYARWAPMVKAFLSMRAA